ncbi:MAG: hypothetical protein DCC67_05250 [Planctomycetota bacterium]|nr:MAG: hypothetical protein DCC67_05250 [Planctomycetota bacterium]
MFGLNVTDWSNAFIDEVRISDTVLTPDQFLFVTAPGGDADFDNDQDVDGNDFLVWQRGQSPNSLSAGDLALWETAMAGGGAAAVPEPATVGLLAAALAGCAAARRRRSM